MFDDVDNKTSDNSSEKGDNNPSAVLSAVSTDKKEPLEVNVQPVPASAPKVPEAPKGPPESTEAKSNAGVEDIFSDTDAGEAEPIKPAAFQPKAGATPEEELSAKQPKGNKLRKIIIPLVLIIILGAIGVGGVYGYKYVINLIGNKEIKENKQSDVIPLTNTEVNESEPEDIVEPAEATEPVQSSPSSPVSVTPPQDTDGDGLSDQEEITLGTNINSVDTDNDGLFDREEVYVYKTDPTNEDTDGDGFLDGAEVQDGYNPNGSGKLYEIN